MPSTILSDNGASSGTAGIKTTGSNDGQLALQTTTAGGTATTAITIDTSQNVGIGATPTAFSTARTLEIAGSSTNSAALRLRGGGDTAGTDDAVIYKVNGNTGAVYIRNYANGRLGFWTNNAQLVEFQTGGAVTLKGASDAANGTGITFPATQSASTDANTLDDYEEGSFTPVIAGSSSAGTASYSQQIGRYTKIGNRVFFQITIVWSSGTGTGNLRITSLPFTNASGTGFNPPPTLVTQNVTYTAGHFATGDVPQGQSRVDVYSCPTGGGAIADVTYDAAGDLYVSGQYFV